jgi:hypothetical protein
MWTVDSTSTLFAFGALYLFIAILATTPLASTSESCCCQSTLSGNHNSLLDIETSPHAVQDHHLLTTFTLQQSTYLARKAESAEFTSQPQAKSKNHAITYGCCAQCSSLLTTLNDASALPNVHRPSLSQFSTTSGATGGKHVSTDDLAFTYRANMHHAPSWQQQKSTIPPPESNYFNCSVIQFTIMAVLGLTTVVASIFFVGLRIGMSIGRSQRIDPKTISLRQYKTCGLLLREQELNEFALNQSKMWERKNQEVNRRLKAIEEREERLVLMLSTAEESCVALCTCQTNNVLLHHSDGQQLHHIHHVTTTTTATTPPTTTCDDVVKERCSSGSCTVESSFSSIGHHPSVDFFLLEEPPLKNNNNSKPSSRLAATAAVSARDRAHA